MQIGNVTQFNSQPDKQIATQQIVTDSSEESLFDLTDTFELSDAEKDQVEKLEARDQEVRLHENKHKAIAGRYAKGVSYSYQTGPDNKQYAIGGSVEIDMAPVANDPEKTIEKMKQIKEAALAPAEPSAQDRKIAREAEREILKHKTELSREKKTENSYAQSGDEIRSTINIYT